MHNAETETSKKMLTLTRFSLILCESMKWCGGWGGGRGGGGGGRRGGKGGEGGGEEEQQQGKTN